MIWKLASAVKKSVERNNSDGTKLEAAKDLVRPLSPS